MTISPFLDNSPQDKLNNLLASTKSVSKTKKNRNIGTTIAELRVHLFEELQALYKGESAPHEAMAFAELSTKVLDTIEMEMKHAAFRQEMSDRKNRKQQQRLLPPPQEPTQPEEDEDL